MRIDYDYLCRITANLSGIPVRVYKGEELLSFHSPVTLIRDPMLLCREQLWQIADHVAYFLTEHFYYYGVLVSGEIRFIVGPTRQLPASNQELREFAFRMGLNKEEAEEFGRSIKAIVNMPVESLLLMLCSVNYMLNGEKLEGKLIRLKAYAGLVNQPITPALCREALRDVFENQRRRAVTPDVVTDRVCTFFSLGREDLIGQSRRREVAQPRQIAMYLTRELTTLSLPQIGTFFGNRDHTTVMHACTQIAKGVKENAELMRQVDDLRQMCREG